MILGLSTVYQRVKGIKSQTNLSAVIGGSISLSTMNDISKETNWQRKTVLVFVMLCRVEVMICNS